MAAAPVLAFWLANERSTARSITPSNPVIANPMWRDVQRIGKRLGLNVSGYKTVTQSRRYEITTASVFTEPPGSFDVVVIGDSTASWGLLENVLRQVSGLKVGVFAYESMLPNERYFPVLDRVVRRALRPDGMVVLFLSEWTIGAQSGEVQRFPTTRALASMGQRTFESRFGWGQWERPREVWFSTDDLAGHTDAIARWIDNLPLLGPAFLPRIHEPRESIRKRGRPSNGRSGIYLWEPTQAVLHRLPRAQTRKAGKVNNAIWERPVVQANAQSLTHLPGKLIYTVPLCDRPELAQSIRGLYSNLFKASMELADLPRMLHPDEDIEFNDRTHVANLGALKQSVLLGEWLRRRAAGQEGLALHAIVPIDVPTKDDDVRDEDILLQ